MSKEQEKTNGKYNTLKGLIGFALMTLTFIIFAYAVYKGIYWVLLITALLTYISLKLLDLLPDKVSKSIDIIGTIGYLELVIVILISIVIFFIVIVLPFFGSLMGPYGFLGLFPPEYAEGIGSPDNPVPLGESLNISLSWTDTEIQVKVIDYYIGWVFPTFYEDEYFKHGWGPGLVLMSVLVNYSAIKGEMPKNDKFNFYVDRDGPIEWEGKHIYQNETSENSRHIEYSFSEESANFRCDYYFIFAVIKPDGKEKWYYFDMVEDYKP